MPFRDFIGGKYGRDLQSSQMYLAKEVLAEIPDQVTGYMKANNFHPKPPQVVSDNNATVTQGYGFSTDPSTSVRSSVTSSYQQNQAGNTSHSTGDTNMYSNAPPHPQQYGQPPIQQYYNEQPPPYSNAL